MARPRYKPVSPDQTIRELRKEFRRLETKEEPGPERAALLAGFTRAAHLERQLNMAMHTAALCLDEDPNAPALLIGAYLSDDVTDPEERLRTLTDLRDLGRYVDDARLRDYVDERVHAEALAWARDATEQEFRHRIRTLQSIFDQRFADGIRDEIEFG